MKKEIYHIKVTSTNFALQVRGFPYRVITIDGDYSLYQLAEAILEAFDFDMDHAFGFYDNLKETHRSWEGYELFADVGEGDCFGGVKTAIIEDVYNELKKKMLFFFDYGDSWRFITQLIDVKTVDTKKRKPQVIKSFGIAPEQYPDWDYDE